MFQDFFRFMKEVLTESQYVDLRDEAFNSIIELSEDTEYSDDGEVSIHTEEGWLAVDEGALMVALEEGELYDRYLAETNISSGQFRTELFAELDALANAYLSEEEDLMEAITILQGDMERTRTRDMFNMFRSAFNPVRAASYPDSIPLYSGNPNLNSYQEDEFLRDMLGGDMEDEQANVSLVALNSQYNLSDDDI